MVGQVGKKMDQAKPGDVEPGGGTAQATEDGDLAAAAGTDPAATAESDAGLLPLSKDDQLSYIEDMTAELREMSARGGFEALSCIFDIALQEARLRRAE